ncbi:hypothetical protein [Halorussus salinus]|uniref:hypothetical protein n=1 Tax=Halorussus salinus TaxID=1364935 RepID=UPI00138F167D|nr:hypothetical protein [Halorussus salinus]
MDNNEKAEIYRSGYEELQNTVENQLTEHHELNQRAIDLAKIDILAISIVVSGTSISDKINGIPIILAGTVALLLSFGYCLQVYRPRWFTNGIGTGATEQIEQVVEQNGGRTEHYRNLMLAFRKMLDYSESSYEQEVKYFRNALWSSSAAILLFSALVPRSLLENFPNCGDYLLISLVVVPVLYGRFLYGGRLD